MCNEAIANRDTLIKSTLTPIKSTICRPARRAAAGTIRRPRQSKRIYELVMFKGRPMVLSGNPLGRIIWSKHAVDELPVGIKPEDVEDALEGRYHIQRGRRKGEYEITCVRHGTFLFLAVVKKRYGFKVKTIRYATEREKDRLR